MSLSLESLVSQASEKRHVDAVRSSLKSSEIPGAFSEFEIEQGKAKLKQEESIEGLNGRLMESLFTWGFYLTNGFLPYVDPMETESKTRCRQKRMKTFERALKDV